MLLSVALTAPLLLILCPRRRRICRRLLLSMLRVLHATFVPVMKSELDPRYASMARPEEIASSFKAVEHLSAAFITETATTSTYE